MAASEPSATTNNNDGVLFDPKVLLQQYWDSKDIDSFVGCFDDIDATWKVNTSPEVSGKDAIEGLTKAVMATTKSSRHHNLSVIVSEQQESPFKTYVVHGSVEYEMLDESKPNVTCRFCDIFEVNESSKKIQKCWTYMDTTPLLTTSSASTATKESTTTAKESSSY